MKQNKEYKQVYLNSIENYSDLKGKVVDKIGYTNFGNADENIFIILFTDKTYIAVGTHYRNLDNRDEEPQLEDFYVFDPKQYQGGFKYWVDDKNNIHFSDSWVNILKNFGIWDLNEEEVVELAEKKKKEEEEREYQQYLRLKEKFEKNERGKTIN